MENQTLASEIIADQSNRLSDIKWRLEDLDLGMSRLKFALGNIYDITAPREAIDDEKLERIHMYTLISEDYVARVKDGMKKIIDSIDD